MGAASLTQTGADDPSLIYDLDTNDHARFLCAMGYNHTAISLLTNTPCPKTNNVFANLNLPSITIPELGRSVTVVRTVANVGPDLSIYTATIEAPPSTDVTEEPSVLAPVECLFC